MGKIAKNYVYTAAYQILVLIAPIVTAPYLARVLGADHLGIYSYINSSGNIITTLSLLGIYAYGNRQTAYVRESRQELTSVFWELETARLFLGIAGTGVYVLYAVLNSKYCGYFFIYYPYILAQFIDCSWVYVGLEDMKPAVLKNFAAKLLNIIGIFLLVKTEEDLWIYILLLALTAFVANLSIYTQLPKYVGKPKVALRRIPSHLKGSVFLFLPQVAALLYLQVDKVMLEWMTGTTREISFYDQAEKIVTIPLSLLTVLSTVMMPRIANEYKKKNPKEIRRLLLWAGRAVLCLAMPMMLGMFCIAGQFIPWYLGKEFLPTATAIRVLTPIILLNSLAGISGNQYFTATDQVSVLLKAYVTAALLNIGVNVLLIPVWGNTGAAVATVLSSLCSVLIQYRCLQKQIDLKVLWGYAIRYSAGAGLMAGILWILGHGMQAAAKTTAIQIIVGVAVYIIYLVLIKDDTIGKIWKMFRHRKTGAEGRADHV